MKVPVLGIAGWHDDARGTIRNYAAMASLPKHPPLRVVMDAGAHKGIDYVNGNFGPQARLDHRALQLRWFDHYLKGLDNGVDKEAPLDFFVMGDNTWRQEREWPLARTSWTNYYLHAGGGLEHDGAGSGSRRRVHATIRAIRHRIWSTRASWSSASTRTTRPCTPSGRTC